MYRVYFTHGMFHVYNYDYTKKNIVAAQEVLGNSEYVKGVYFWRTDETEEELNKLCSVRKDIKYLGALDEVSPESIIRAFPEVFL